MTLPEFRKVLLESILDKIPGCEYVLTEEDLTQIEARKQARYDTWEWNYGNSPACTFSKKARFEGCGSIEAFLTMDQSRIRDISFRGDFFAAEDPAALVEALKDRALEPKELEAALEQVDIGRYFMGLSKSQFLSLLLT
jgi:lipoate-protein ligase A